MWYVLSKSSTNRHFIVRYVQLSLDNGDITGVCGISDAILSRINMKSAGFGLSMSEYAKRQYEIPKDIKQYRKALGVLVYNNAQVHLRIYKFQKDKGSHTYKPFKYNYYIGQIG